MEKPYHKFVFEHSKRKFLGKFEEMYDQEDAQGYDSWGSEDMTLVFKNMAKCFLDRYTFRRILDAGCGKGTFTQALKKENNYVLGLDISKTAIAKAKQRCPKIDFQVMPLELLINDFPWEGFDLILSREVLSYMENWRQVLAVFAPKTEYLFVSLYIPENPLGFVKSFAELKFEVNKNFKIEHEVHYNSEYILLMAKSNLVQAG